MRLSIKIISVIVLLTYSSGCSDSSSNEENLLTKIDKLESKLEKYQELYGELSDESQNSNKWEIRYYVDEFGDKTNSGYITNSKYILGTFSNSATEDSDLGVEFLISNSDDVSIQLYEYLDNNPVKGPSGYSVFVKDSKNNKYELDGYISTDRLSIEKSEYYDETGNKVLAKSQSKLLYNLLMSGEYLKFRIEEIGNRTTVYNFVISKNEGFSKLEKLLKN
jgi:chaperonin cofactor prefoldin